MTTPTIQDSVGQRPVATLGDWPDIARRHFKLLREIDRYDVREKPASIAAERRPVRALAKAIIEGRRAWPPELICWKEWRECSFHHGGRGALPPWEDQQNLTLPQRERERAYERELRNARAKFDAIRHDESLFHSNRREWSRRFQAACDVYGAELEHMNRASA